MPRRKLGDLREVSGTEKEPVTAGTVPGSEDSVPSAINSNTDLPINQEFFDDDKGRHFGYVVYPSEDWIRANCPDCKYDGNEGWGTAPDDWPERLRQTGLAFAYSPLHYLDEDYDAHTGTMHVKKPHWHLIVSWANSTTYRTAKALTATLNCPKPVLLRAPIGYYRYFNHRDNPEKYQYSDPPVHVNGWVRPLDNAEVDKIIDELEEAMYLKDCQEYAEILSVARMMGPEYRSVARKNAYLLVKMCSAYRNNPIRCLYRYIETLPEGEVRDKMIERLEYFTNQADDERS